MTEQYDSIEREMGIFSYASSVTENSGFAAVLKARYSDFLVHEGKFQRKYILKTIGKD